ncbi:MAG: GNAT family acetyltransferase [Gammaproteobacteria bacterium]|nr:GNAT family acetyltransferase [Gammaproteobacteria bacterium]
MLEIRLFRDDDEPEVIQLWQDCKLIVPWNDPQKDIQRKLDAGADLFLVGEYDSLLVASVMGGYDGHRGWVYYLAVAPMFRNRGFAHAMMAKMESRLVALGCPKINLLVRNTNAEVMELYQSLGYSIDQTVSLGKRLIPDD